MNNKIKQIYICAPSGYASGGPEALHQFANEIKYLGYDVKMFYFSHRSDIKYPRHKNYDIYDIDYIVDESELKNDIDSCVIVPETACELLLRPYVSNMKKIVWWLSVDFYFLALKNNNKYFGLKRFLKRESKFPSLDKLKKLKNVIHLPNSFYTQKFLSDNLMNAIEVVSDYLNFNYTSHSVINKEDIVIYNPAKNGWFLNQIMNKAPEIKWIPIQNMTQTQVKETMSKAKVYIDFGFHPGRERMPREACLAKCCLIIGKDGAAKYKEDMPIMDDYHFDANIDNINQIINKINDCFINYDNRVKDFANYERNIMDAKSRFNKEVEFFLKSINLFNTK